MTGLATLPGETVEWAGRPRRSSALPGVATGVVLAAAGVGVLVAGLSGGPVEDLAPGMTAVRVAGALLVLAGVAVAARADLRVRRTRFVVTDRALYRRGGVLSRSVRRVELHRVQDASLSQPVTGRVAGYGTLAFDVAGAEPLVFDRIGDPTAVRRHSERVSERARIPGTVEQWRLVREEVRALRRAVVGDGRDGT